jgi:hypothetical protein
MRKSEMNDKQLKERSFLVNTLSDAGWRGSNFNRDFDEGLWSSPEASMTYSNPTVSLRLDMSFDDPRQTLYIESSDGKSLGLVFKCPDRLNALMQAIIGMQDAIAPGNIKEKAEELLAVCPNMFKISASGDQLLPVRPRKST